MIDVYRPAKDSVILLDFNPFGETTDGLLFSWRELQGEDDIRQGLNRVRSTSIFLYNIDFDVLYNYTGCCNWVKANYFIGRIYSLLIYIYILYNKVIIRADFSIMPQTISLLLSFLGDRGRIN